MLSLWSIHSGDEPNLQEWRHNMETMEGILDIKTSASCNTFTRYGLIAIYKHPIQRGVEITQDVSCYRNRDKLRAGWPFGLYADLNLSSTEVWSPNCSINPPFEVSAAAKSQVEKRLDTGTKYLIAIAGTKYLRGYKVWKLEGHNRTSYHVNKKERAFQKSRKSATGWR